MIAMGVHHAKTQLPKLLKRVRRGERFLITKYGRPVAELVPAAPGTVLDLKHVIEQGPRLAVR